MKKRPTMYEKRPTMYEKRPSAERKRHSSNDNMRSLTTECVLFLQNVFS